MIALISGCPTKDGALVSAQTAEIVTHIVVYFLVIVPITGFIIPATLMALELYVLAHALEPVLPPRLSALVETSWIPIFVFSSAVLLLITIVRAFKAGRKFKQEDLSLNAATRRPFGSAGLRLEESVRRIWDIAGRPNAAAPTVSWFSAFTVSARAQTDSSGKRLHVSSELWKRVAQGDLLGDLILAHEIAHIVHRDPTVFRVLAILIRSIRTGLRFEGCVLIGATGAIVVLAATQAHADGISWVKTFQLVLSILVVTSLGGIALAAANLILRRYGSLIIALIELRADVHASVRTIGLREFSNVLENDQTLHRSTITDLGRSLLAPDLSHLSESERIDLIRNTARLATPKLRYFALSLVLTMLLPLNLVTPLLEGGALDHALVALAAATLVTAIVTMLLLSSVMFVLPWIRAFALATAASLAISISQVNLYEFGYLFTSYAVGIAQPGGFGSGPLSWSSFQRDAATAVAGLVKGACDGAQGYWIVPSILVTALSLKVLAALARRDRNHGTDQWHIFVTAALTFFLSLLVARDPWRDYFYSIGPLAIAESMTTFMQPLPWMRLCLPVLAALAFTAAWTTIQGARRHSN